MTEHVPVGMIEVWTVERPKDGGVFIDDLKETEAQALAEVTKRGAPWTSVRLVVPYGDS